MHFDSNHFNPLFLSIELGKFASQLNQFQRGKLSHRAPFFTREFPGLSTYQQVETLHAEDPLRKPLLRWIARLTDTRIHLPWLQKDQSLEFDERHSIREPTELHLSLAEIRRSALGAQEHQVEHWWKNYARHEASLSEHRIEHWARRAQVSARLGIESHSDFWQSTFTEGEVHKGLLDLARLVLTETQDASENAWGIGWALFSRAGLALDAPEGWPARLAQDTLRELLGARELFRAVVLQPGGLPKRMAPMSFVRAGSQIGRALSHALRPKDLPFVLSFDPNDLSGHEAAELFAMWMSSPVFLKRKLGLGSSAWGQAQRHYGSARLAHLRLAAARLSLYELALRGPRAVSEEFSALSFAFLGRELPQSAALSRFRVRADEPARFCATLRAALKNHELTEDYDEDWLENPRAQEQLRAEWSTPCTLQRPLSEVLEGFKLFKKEIVEAI